MGIWRRAKREARPDEAATERRHLETRADTAEGTKAARSQARGTWVNAAIGLIVAVTTVAGLWLSLSNDGKNDENTNDQGSTSEEGLGTLQVDHSWPTFRGCDGTTGVAVSSDGPDLGELLDQASDQPDVDDRVVVAERGGGAWGVGHLYVFLRSSTSEPLTIVNLHPRILSSAVAPASGVYVPEGACGGTYERVFELDLDSNAFHDLGLVDDGGAGDEPAAMRSEEIGPAFKVSADEDAVLRIDVSACAANYRWSLVIEYLSGGEKHREVVGPFLSLGTAEAAEAYGPTAGPGSPIEASNVGHLTAC